MEFSPTDLLNMPDDISAIVRALIRKNGMTAAEISSELDMPPEQAQEKLNDLVKQGTLRAITENGIVVYKVSYQKKSARKTSDRLLRLLED